MMVRFLLFAVLMVTAFLISLLLYRSGATLNDWLMGLFTYVIAAAAILALFQDWVRSLIWHPELKVTINPRPPDSHKTSAYYNAARDGSVQQLEAPCYYYRLHVHNRGRAAARDAEVYVRRVERMTSTGEWAQVERFIPQHLAWSLLGEIRLPILPPNATRSCDVGYVIDPKFRRFFHETEQDELVSPTETIFGLAVQVKALRRGHLLPKGKYRLTLEIAASNAEPNSVTIAVNNPGLWFDDETTMLRDGVAAYITPKAEQDLK